MTGVAIVDDHLLLAETLRAALEQAGIDAVVVPPRPMDELAADLRCAAVGLVLLDLDLGPFGSDSTPVIRALAGDGIRVLVITGSTDRLLIAAALEQGAVGWQSKAAGFAELVAATGAALAADGPLDPAGRGMLLEELYRARARRERELAPFRELTAREADTLRALTAGFSVGQIATQWVVSETTVRSHVRGILSKLGVSSQLAAVAAASRTGLFAGPP
jgi:DNA-binding NarL/FixJ family response regulator